MSSVNHGIPFVPENTTDPAAGLNLAIHKIDALVQVSVVAIVNTPPGSPGDGQRWIVGPEPTGAWAGEANKVARWVEADNAWDFHDVILALNQDDGIIYGFDGSVWGSVQGLPWDQWQGAWVDSTDYVVLDAVSHEGTSYIATAANGPGTTVVEPGVTADWENYWDVLAAKGSAGTAAAATYDNTISEMTAENVQDAIDELKALIDAITAT